MHVSYVGFTQSDLIVQALVEDAATSSHRSTLSTEHAQDGTLARMESRFGLTNWKMPFSRVSTSIDIITRE